MPKNHRTAAGECIDSLAYANRLPPEEVWNDQANRELKEQRKDRNVLQPDDQVMLQDPPEKWEAGRVTEQMHVFRRALPKMDFRFQIVWDKVRNGIQHEITVDDRPVPAVVEGDWLCCRIPPDARVAKIRLHYVRGQGAMLPVLREREFTVNLGFLRPVSLRPGQEDRLRNLGYLGPPANQAAEDPDLDPALAHFQASNGIDATAEGAVAQTTAQLRNLTGDPP